MTTVHDYRFTSEIELRNGKWVLDCVCYDCGQRWLSYTSATGTVDGAIKSASQWMHATAVELGINWKGER